MTVLGINHVNLRTLDLPATVRFYTHLLGLRYDGPSAVDGFERHWLYDGAGHPIIHLRELAPAGAETGAFDHVAFTCNDMAGTIARLEAGAIRFAARENKTDGIVQLFVTDPNGIAIELNFALADPQAG